MGYHFSLKESSQKKQFGLFVFCAALFIYALLRVIYVPFTFDEITTSQIVGGEDWVNFGVSANNHMLNSALIRVILWFADPSIFLYRLPNLLSFILYLCFAVKLGKLLTTNKPYLTTSVLVLMPYLLDFFSIARGYGLSISFLSGSIYYVLVFSKSIKISHLFGAIFFGICAVLSNYTLLNFFLPLLFVLFVFIMQHKEQRLIKLVCFTLITGVFMYMIIPILFELKDGHHLIFGGRDNFFNSTVLSLGRSFGYGILNIKFAESIFTILFSVALIYSIIEVVCSIRNRKFESNIVLPIIFVLMILSPVTQNMLFDTFFPAERTALMYYPVMVLLLIQGMIKYFERRSYFMLNVISFGLLAHFLFTINFSHTYSWRYESGTKNVINCLEKISIDEGRVINIGTNYIYTPSTWYYRSEMRSGELEIHDVIGCCWGYNMSIEELNPIYYGAGENSKQHMDMEDIKSVFKDNFDYYYLNGYTVNELSRNKVRFKMIKAEENANAFLIQLRDSI